MLGINFSNFHAASLISTIKISREEVKINVLIWHLIHDAAYLENLIMMFFSEVSRGIIYFLIIVGGPLRTQSIQFHFKKRFTNRPLSTTAMVRIYKCYEVQSV